MDGHLYIDGLIPVVEDFIIHSHHYGGVMNIMSDMVHINPCPTCGLVDWTFVYRDDGTFKVCWICGCIDMTWKANDEIMEFPNDDWVDYLHHTGKYKRDD